jgi:hypothetical protein
VDTTRIAAGEDFLTNQQNMRMKVDKAWALILSSYPKFPPGMILCTIILFGFFMRYVMSILVRDIS